MWRSLRSLIRRRRLERELDAELQVHLERQIEENLGCRMSPSEARRAAVRAIGRSDTITQDCREAWGIRQIDVLARDVRFGVRGLRRNPAFTLAAIVTLAIGIGATTVVFSVVDDVLLRPLPFPDRGVYAPKVITDVDRRTRGGGWWNVIARLKADVPVRQARVEMDAIAQQLAAEFSKTNSGTSATVVPLFDQRVGNVRAGLWLLQGAVVLVLLIACVNIANLLLARTMRRRREFAVRAASRARQRDDRAASLANRGSSLTPHLVSMARPVDNGRHRWDRRPCPP